MPDLVADTLHLLKRTKEPLPAIAKAADVGYEWLKRFNRGEVDNPTYRPLQRLHDHLAAQPELAETE